MNPWDGWGWWMPFHGVFSLALLILVIVGVVVFIRSLISGTHPRIGSHGSSGLDILEERYAKGEIQRDEYLQKRRDLGG